MRFEFDSNIPSTYQLALEAAESQLLQISAGYERAEVLLQCGTLCRALGQSQSAHTYLREALHHFEEYGNVAKQTRTLIELAHSHALQGDYRTVLAELHHAWIILRPYRAIYPDLYAALAFRIGSSLRELGYTNRGIRCLQLCCDVASDHHLFDLHAMALTEIGEHRQNIEETERQQYRESALAVLEASPQPSREAMVLCLYRWDWDLPDGRAKREEAYHLAMQLGAIELIVRTANTLSIAYWRLKQSAQAASGGEFAVQLAQEYSYNRLEALCSSELAVVVYRAQGQYDRAKILLERAIGLREQMIWRQEQRRSLAAALGNLGSIYKQTEELDRALACFQESYTLHKQGANKKGMRIQANNIGTVYHRLGRWEEAKQWYDEARRIAQDVLSSEAAERALAGNLASLYHQWGRRASGVEREERLRMALGFVELALSDPNPRKRSRNAIFNIGRKGQFLLDLGRAAEALPWLFRSYRMSRRSKRQKEPTKRMATISKAYLRLDKPYMACKAATIGITYAERNPEWAWSRALASAYEARAKAYRKLNELDRALSDYQKAAELLQQSYRLLDDEDMGLNLAARLTKLYDEAIQFSYEEGRLREAFRFLEMARQPVYRQRLAVTQLAAPVEIPEHLINRERSLLEMLSKEVPASIGDAEEESENTRETTIQKQQDQARRLAKQELEGVWSQMREIPAAAEYIALRKGEGISYERLLSLLAESQPQHTLLAAFYVTEHEILLFGISPMWYEPKVMNIPFGRRQLRAFVEEYHRRLSHVGINRAATIRNALSWFEQQATLLLSQLIGALYNWTEPEDFIYLVPHDMLHYLPLHAVMVNGTYLIERNPVLYSPSASILEYCMRKRKKRRASACIFADAQEDNPIVFAREQARAVRDLFDAAWLYEGPNASQKHLIDALHVRRDEIDILHFAVHGTFSLGTAKSSGVELADGRLTPEKIFALSMHADLVMMSACDSGVGEHHAGDEMIGLTRALIYAGTPSVVGSLWSVDALSTSILIEKFYTALIIDGRTKVEALRYAQLYVKNLTVRTVLSYAERARTRLDGDDQATAYLDWTIAEIRFFARDYEVAEACYRELLKRPQLERAIADKAGTGLLRAQLASMRPTTKNYEQYIFSDLFNWAPFVLVGDWR